MPDSLRTQLSELASYASGNARLGTPAALRQHGTRRSRRRRGGVVLLGVGVAAAVGANAGITHPGATGLDTARGPASTASSAQLTSYQTGVLAKAHVTKAQVAALAKSGFTADQISALAADVTRLMQQDKNAITTARTAAGYLARYCTRAEQAVLLGERLKTTQIAALARARLSAAQLAALAAG